MCGSNQYGQVRTILLSVLKPSSSSLSLTGVIVYQGYCVLLLFFVLFLRETYHQTHKSILKDHKVDILIFLFLQLCSNNNTDAFSPRPLTYFANKGIAVSDIAAGANHVLFVSSSGDIYGCGDNSYGQLGLNPAIYRTVHTPMLLPDFNTSNPVDCFSRRVYIRNLCTRVALPLSSCLSQSCCERGDDVCLFVWLSLCKANVA